MNKYKGEIISIKRFKEAGRNDHPYTVRINGEYQTTARAREDGLLKAVRLIDTNQVIRG